MDPFYITLFSKRKLTHDVYELIYSCDNTAECKPGQFLMCETDENHPKLRRAYSVSDYSRGNFHFIIKEIANGGGGSQAICQQIIGHTMRVWWPHGHFVLPEIAAEKITFIGTWTGFAPLYFQAKSILANNNESSIDFIFGVRSTRDLLYQDIISEWSKKYPHFVSHFCLSQDHETEYYRGRVTGYISENIVCAEPYTIYSICWSPSMVKEVRELLAERGVPKERIFFEQY